MIAVSTGTWPEDVSAIAPVSIGAEPDGQCRRARWRASAGASRQCTSQDNAIRPHRGDARRSERCAAGEPGRGGSWFGGNQESSIGEGACHIGASARQAARRRPAHRAQTTRRVSPCRELDSQTCVARRILLQQRYLPHTHSEKFARAARRQRCADGRSDAVGERRSAPGQPITARCWDRSCAAAGRCRGSRSARAFSAPSPLPRARAWRHRASPSGRRRRSAGSRGASAAALANVE